MRNSYREKLEPVLLRLPPKLLKEIDILWRKLNYSDRSEFLRTIIREKVEELKKGIV